MNRFCQRFDQRGLNPRIVLLVLSAAAVVGCLIFSLLPHRIRSGVVRRDEILPCDLHSLGSFEFDERSGTLEDIPAAFRKLDGQKVSLEGFMVPSGEVGKISDFQFIYNIQGQRGPPLVQQRVFVSTRDHESVDFVPDEIRIIGTLHVNVERDKDTGAVLSIYKMDLDRIEPL